jgi:hypothetical protein
MISFSLASLPQHGSGGLSRFGGSCLVVEAGLAIQSINVHGKDDA